jgi:hypothetical protein
MKTTEITCKVCEFESGWGNPACRECGRVLDWKLVSAAPDLLSALEFLLADYMAICGESLTHSTVPADKARDAIKKAKI